jgi:hypothetical protein
MVLRHPAPATVISLVALFFSLSGAAFAAKHYVLNSTSQINPKVLKALKGKTGAKGARGAAGATGATGAPGATGAQGATGAAGAPGSAIGYAHLLVSAGGVTLDATRSKNVAQVNVTHPATGVVCFSGMSFVPHNVAGVMDATTSGNIIVNAALAPDAPVTIVCGATGQAAIQITNPNTGTNTDHDVYVTFN